MCGKMNNVTIVPANQDDFFYGPKTSGEAKLDFVITLGPEKT